MGLGVCLLEVTLTDTLSREPGKAGAVVALKPSQVVTGKHLSTGLA